MIKTEKLLFIVLITLILIACGRDIKSSGKNTGYKSEVMLNLFSLDTSNDFVVKVPESNIECKIRELVSNGEIKMAKGSYEDGHERGEIFIDYLKIHALNESDKDNFYFFMPFVVTNQGSGSFYYMGLFHLDLKANKINHVNYEFLGDRIKIDTIEYDGHESVKVKIRTHSSEQSMAEEPAESRELDYKVNKTGIQLIKQ